MHPILEFIKKEWSVLKQAPFSFAALVLVTLGMTYEAVSWHYSGQISSLKEQISDKDGQIHRYRVVLGIDKQSEGVLIELSNEELKATSLSTAVRLREMCFSARDKQNEVKAECDSGRIDKKACGERTLTTIEQASDEFDRRLRSDTFLIDSELRRRLGPKAVAAIVGIAPSFVTKDGTRINIFGVVPGGSGFEAAFLCVLADGIEQMAKLLPPDSDKR